MARFLCNIRFSKYKGAITSSLSHLDCAYAILPPAYFAKLAASRVLLIHSSVANDGLSIIESYNNLFTHTHRSSYTLTYDKYRARFAKIRDELNLNPNHKAHDPRKQFVTMAKKYKVDEYAIKRIVGHAILDITEKVYTERDLEWLQEEIAKIV